MTSVASESSVSAEREAAAAWLVLAAGNLALALERVKKADRQLVSGLDSERVDDLTLAVNELRVHLRERARKLNPSGVV